MEMIKMKHYYNEDIEFYQCPHCYQSFHQDRWHEATAKSCNISHPDGIFNPEDPRIDTIPYALHLVDLNIRQGHSIHPVSSSWFTCPSCDRSIDDVHLIPTGISKNEEALSLLKEEY